ncbi:alcohol dehydrogenase, partial [Colletotrichum scovillei]
MLQHELPKSSLLGHCLHLFQRLFSGTLKHTYDGKLESLSIILDHPVESSPHVGGLSGFCGDDMATTGNLKDNIV